MAVVAAVALLATACDDSSSSRDRSTPSTGEPGIAVTTTAKAVPLGPAIVFGAQARELDAYATTRPFVNQTVVPSPAADRDGVDVSGQICFDPTNPRRFVAVDLTAAADGQSGWGVFELSGRALGKLSAKEVARLVPTFQPSIETGNTGPLPFGCGFLPDGRLLTTDVGNPSTGAANGQLIEWFPPFDQDDPVARCKVDVALAGPKALLVDGGSVFVAESRGRGVTSFVTASLPTSNESSGGCTRQDTTGAPFASGVVQSKWLRGTAATAMSRPAAVAPAGNGNYYVSSPSTGVIAEVSGAGLLVRRVLSPPAGEKLGVRTFSTGTPLGLGVGPDGTLYYADPGLVMRDGTAVAGLRAGTVRRIAFTGGVPQRPEIVDTGLQSPAGIGIWIPSA